MQTETQSPTSEHADTEEQRAFRLRAREWMKGRMPPRIPGQHPNPFGDLETCKLDRATQRTLWEGNLAGITLPREYGGLGLGQRFEEIFWEEAQPYRLPWTFGNSFNIVVPVLLAHGSEAQKKKYIPATLKSEIFWCQLLSEPSGGSDLAGVLTRAERRDGRWLLNGGKIWTTGGHVSDMGLCLARTDPTVRKHAGLTMFLVDLHHPGVTLQRIKLITGESEFCQEFFDDVEVPDEDVVGAVNDGWNVAQAQLAAERAGMARGWHGGFQAAEVSEQIELTPEYIETARGLGLAEDPFARQQVGEAFVLDAVYHLTLRRVAAGTSNGRLPQTAGMVASLLAARTNVRRTELLSALTGPAGVASLPDAPGADAGMQRVTMHRIGGGTQETQRNLVSERHLGLPREPAFDRDLPFNQLKTNAPR